MTPIMRGLGAARCATWAVLPALALAALGPPTYTAPPFPTSAFSSYYVAPTGTQQAQPVIVDPVSGKTYEPELTDPNTIPQQASIPPLPLPSGILDSSEYLRSLALAQILAIANSSAPAWKDSCTKCLAGTSVAKSLAAVAPSEIPTLAIELCEKLQFSSSCNVTFSILNYGALVAQLLQMADVAGLDGQNICNYIFNGLCPAPSASPLGDLSLWFSKPKPSDANEWVQRRRTQAGQRLKVLHLSDVHLDPRYSTGSEVNCTSSLCCRNPSSSQGVAHVQFPAPYYGAYKCDSPLALVMAAFQSIPNLTDTQATGFAWSIYTGDLVSHDPNNQLSQDYVTYTETVVYEQMKRYLGSGPLYAALGNHDTYPAHLDIPHAGLPDDIENEFSWNYEHLSTLWEQEQWISPNEAEQARAHYAGYSVKRQDGLRIITLNTDFWYPDNYFAYINMTNPDISGMLRFLTDELQAAEDAQERAWIVGHVLTGWDGSNGLPNPTNLFYQIVDRFSPHVIAGIFFGHTHEDMFSIYYANNATTISAATAQTVAWIGPSIVTLGNLNTGFRMYEVDSETFEILDAHTWYSDASSFSTLDHEGPGPTWKYEYSARDAYGGGINWPSDAPLNATWWHKVTERMEADPSLVQKFTTYQGKLSQLTPACTSADCVKQKICYMRSGSVPISRQNCQTPQ